MANINITPITLGGIELIVNGERLNQTNLNRPIIQLRDNQIAQNGMLDEIYAAFGSDDTNLDSMQEVVDEVTANSTLLSTLSGSLSSIGLDSTVAGSLTILDSVIVANGITIDGLAVATENYVLLNGGGGGAGGGGVEITKVFEFTGNNVQTQFDFPFISTSVAIYVEGIKVPIGDYTLNYDVDSLGINVDFDTAPNSGNIVTCIAFGGADVYTKTQVDALFVSELNSYYNKTYIDANLSTTTEVGTAISTAISNIPTDSTPTNGSNNLVRSNGVYDAIQAVSSSSIAQAWCTIDGTGAVSILNDYNVVGLVDAGVGYYNITLGTSMGTNYYAVLATADSYYNTTITAKITNFTTFQLKCGWEDGENTKYDADRAHVAVFR